MAELPEILKLCAQMDEALRGKRIQTLELLQEKCANIPPEEFQRRVQGARFTHVANKGKWILMHLDNAMTILLSLGMGANVLYFKPEDALPDKYQVRLVLDGGDGFTIRFWWFGKFLLAARAELDTEPNTAGIALHPLEAEFTPDYFVNLCRGKRTGVKSFLMNQKNVGGIGNMYMHDILFRAGVHPLKKLSELDDAGLHTLYESMRQVLLFSQQRGSFSRETDFYGEGGGYTPDDFLVGYREDLPCPGCGQAVQCIKTGGTSSYICPRCQPL